MHRLFDLEMGQVIWLHLSKHYGYNSQLNKLAWTREINDNIDNEVNKSMYDL